MFKHLKITQINFYKINMKKIIFLSICLALCAKHCYAINVFHAFKYAANRSINIIYNSKEYINIAVDIITMAGDISELASKVDEKNTTSQPTDNVADELLQIRQTIADLIINNTDSKIGGYGLPMVCDTKIKKLISLPGGQEVLKELQKLFENFFKAQ